MPANLWTYTLPSRDGCHKLHMPKVSEVLGLHEVEGGDPTLVVFVDTDSEIEQRLFLVAAVGQRLPSATLRFIGTFRDGRNLKAAFELDPKECRRGLCG